MSQPLLAFPLGGPVAWLSPLLAAGLILLGLRLRGRLAGLRTLAPSDRPAEDGHRFVTAAGVELDAATQRAASAFASTHGLAVLDLVPADLPVDRALALARAVDAAAFRADRLARAPGAGHALLVDAAVLDRAGEAATAGLDPVALARLAARLKWHASTATDLAVAPGLRATDPAPGERAAFLKARYTYWSPITLGLELFTYLALAAGLVANPVLGAAAVLAFAAQPLVALAGGPLAPRDLALAAALRIARGPLRWPGTVAALAAPEPRADAAALRATYARDLAGGTARFFEPRRHDCPWCGGSDLATWVTCPDRYQHKPGRFVLQRCGACGHVFQNPRLSPAGLAFYYREFYDGLGAGRLESMFTAQRGEYLGRVALIKPFTTPSAWLDVGAGHGHFCNLARDTWPGTVFDGLDIGASIKDAERRGWVDHGHHGQLLDLAGTLAGRYDVVSMFHYLEHTREPFAELDAVAGILRPGGYLLLELPNPASRYGRVLRSRWVPWLQPQHQHMMPPGNLERALAERGFVIVAADRGKANQPTDLTYAAGLTVDALAPEPDLPWRPESGSGARLAHVLAWVLGAPFVVAGGVLDGLLHQVTSRSRGGNAYRILARRDG